MSGVAWDYPIGRWNPKVNNEQVTYRGHFDGQGHSITGFDYTTAQNWHGFFGVISHGAIVENFSISGTVTNENWGTLGTVSFSRGGNSIIRNIRSSMNFISKKNGFPQVSAQSDATAIYTLAKGTLGLFSSEGTIIAVIRTPLMNRVL